MKIGIDIVDINRFQRAVERWGDLFIQRVFTKKEIAYCSKQKDGGSFAARFAAKEAFFKALGTGLISWKEVEVLDGGPPKIVVYGRSKELLNGRKVEVSLSHERLFAVAVVIIY